MPDFKILCETSFEPGDVETIHNAGSINGMPKDQETENLIQERWSVAVGEARKRDVEIFNGMLFRLNNLSVTKDNKLVLQLGDTTYREYAATRAGAFRKSRQDRDLANPLALCIAITTTDGRIVIEKRGNVDVYSGRYHVIGGFMERPHDFYEGTPNPFHGIAREVEEEVGLKLPAHAVRLTGVVYDLITPHPELCFCAESNLSSREITRIFLRSEKDHEVEKLSYIDASKEKLGEFIVSRRRVTSVTGQACLLLYGKHKYGAAWFRTVLDSLD